MLEHAAIAGTSAAGATNGAAIGMKLNQVLDQLGAQAKAAAKADQPAAKKAEPVQVSQQRQKSDFTNGPPPPPPGEPRSSSDDSNSASAPAPSAAPAPAASSDPAPKTDRVVSAMPVRGDEVPVPIFAAAPAPAPKPPRTQEQLLSGLAAIQPGVTRDQVIDKLGSATYKIAYNDGGHVVERLRFRAAGGVDVVVVELSDGVVQSARSLLRKN